MIADRSRLAAAAVAALLFVVVAAAPIAARSREESADGRRVVNFAWLESLRAQVSLSGKGTVTVWRTAPASLALRAGSHQVGPPSADLAAAPNLISTDDVAWVALAYLKSWEVQRRGASRDEARAALVTLLALQRPDGTFPAYVAPDAHALSPVSADNDWPATSRAVQALGEGLRILGPGDVHGPEIRASLALVTTRVRALWSQPERAVGKELAIGGQSVPAWLPAHRADVAAGLALGLLALYEVDHEQQDARNTARYLCDAMVDLQKGSRAVFPWLAFLPRADQPSFWYGDDAFQIAALVKAAADLNKPSYLSSAQVGVDSMIPLLLAAGGSPWQFSPRPQTWPQLPGTAAALASNVLALDQAGHRDRYVLMGGLLASWFVAGDGAHVPYDPSSGRCADALTAEGAARSASPGSAARALYTLLQVGKGSAARYSSAHPGDLGLDPIVVEAVEGRPVREPFTVEAMDLPGGRRRVARMGREQAFWLRFDVKTAGRYGVDLIYLKDSAAGRSVDVRLDGDAITEVPLAMAGEGQFLRREHAVAATDLAPGLHTLGVRCSALWAGDVVLDAFVIQPLAPWRAWTVQPDRGLILLRNLGETDLAVTLPGPSGGKAPRYAQGFDASSRSASLQEKRGEAGAWQFTVPGLGFGIVEW